MPSAGIDEVLGVGTPLTHHNWSQLQHNTLPLTLTLHVHHSHETFTQDYIMGWMTPGYLPYHDDHPLCHDNRHLMSCCCSSLEMSDSCPALQLQQQMGD